MVIHFMVLTLTNDGLLLRKSRCFQDVLSTFFFIIRCKKPCRISHASGVSLGMEMSFRRFTTLVQPVIAPLLNVSP